MAQPLHQVSEGRPCRGRKSLPGVTLVVEPETDHPKTIAGARERLRQGVTRHRSTVGRHEHPRVSGVVPKVLLEERDDMRWQRHSTEPGIRLGLRVETRSNRQQLDLIAVHADHAGLQVNVGAAQSKYLAPAKSSPGGQQDRRLVLSRYLIDERRDLLRRCDRSALRPRRSRPRNLTWIAREQTFADRGVEDSAKQSVRLVH